MAQRQKLPQVDIGIITATEAEFRAALDVFNPEQDYRGAAQDYEIATVATSEGQSIRVAILRSISDGNVRSQSTAVGIIQDLKPSFLLVVGSASGAPASGP